MVELVSVLTAGSASLDGINVYVTQYFLILPHFSDPSAFIVLHVRTHVFCGRYYKYVHMSFVYGGRCVHRHHFVVIVIITYLFCA